MDKFKLINRLKDKTNITYEEAQNVLESNNWDLLDATLYLEKRGIIKKPSISVFYTNENKGSYAYQNKLANIEEEKSDNFRTKNSYHGVFEALCKIIDTYNNIFIEVKRKDKILFKLPSTVLIVLLLFAFWIIIPFIIIGLFNDIDFLVSSKNIDVERINKFNKMSKKASKYAKDIKRKFKKEFN